MLVNLLARQDSIVERVILDCPQGVALAGRVIPLARRDRDLRTALLEGAAAIDCVPVVGGKADDSVTARLVVGPGAPVAAGMRVHGERWWGGVSNGAINGPHMDSSLPYGPYAAACLAAGEVFKAVRLATPAASVVTAFYSTWSLRAMDAPPTGLGDIGPQDVEAVELDVTVAGAGAVGSTWIHAVWATVGLRGRAVVADADELGVDRTNLNRCPVFGRDSTGRRKATEAARICSDASVTLVPHDGPVGDVEDRPPFMVSAVDTNTSRRAVQGLYPPRLLSASTNNLRAEMMRCDPAAGASCISCFNPLESAAPDVDLRRQFLGANRETRQRLAAEVGLSMEAAEHWAVDGTCSYATDRLLARLRDSHQGAAAFAVGFVSVMAGTILAAQTLREFDGGGALHDTLARAVMQFLDPLAKTNAPRRQLRDADCPLCDPGEPATAIWRRRYERPDQPRNATTAPSNPSGDCR